MANTADAGGLVRVVRAYDVSADRILERLEIYDGEKQYGVDIEVPATASDVELTRLREPALVLLREAWERGGKKQLFRLPDVFGIASEYVDLGDAA